MNKYRVCKQERNVSADVFSITSLKKQGRPSLFAVLDTGELFVQPSHVGLFGLDAMELLFNLDGAGQAYVIVPTGFSDMERVDIDQSLLVSIAWLKESFETSGIEDLVIGLERTLLNHAEGSRCSDLELVKDVAWLAGIEGVSDVVSEH
jgi:hypothetical protein